MTDKNISSSRPKSASPKAKSKKLRVDDILRQNDELLRQIDELREEKSYLREKLKAICEQIIAITEQDELCLDDITDLTEISTEDYLIMLTRILTRKERLIKDSLEQRVVELETRITQQDIELATLLKSKLSYEHALEDIAICDNIYAARQKARQMLLNLQSEDPSVEYPRNASALDLLTKFKLMSRSAEFANHVVIDNLPNTSVFAPFDETRPLSPPTKKLPGNTHISEMHTGVKQHIIQYLNANKTSGCDWRALAVRVGIPRELVQYWHALNLDSPTTRVLAEWERSPAATVRVLHRHLLSEQLRCTAEAKLISDFYKVD